MGEGDPRSRDFRLVPPAVLAWIGALAGLFGVGRWALLAAAAVLVGALVLWVRGASQAAAGTACAAAGALLVATLSGHAALDTYLKDPVQGAGPGPVQALVRLEDFPVKQQTSWEKTSLRVGVDVTWVAKENTWQRSRAQLMLSADEKALGRLQRGETVLVEGRLEEGFWTSPPRAGLLRATSVQKTGEVPFWQRTPNEVRTRLRQLTEELPEGPGGLILGMSVGDRSQLPGSLAEAMRTASLTHLTAISGTHIGVLLLAMRQVVPGGRWARPLAAGGLLAALLAVVGPAPSLIRATLMAAVGVFGTVAGRAGQGQSALALVVLTTAIVSPWTVKELGFVLSVLATWGILTFGRTWAARGKERIRAAGEHLGPLERRIRQAVLQGAGISLAATLWTLPVLVTLNPWAPTWAVPANLLAAPVAGVVTLLGLAAGVGALIAPGVSLWLVRLAVPFAAWIELVGTTAASLPAAQFPWPRGSTGVGAAVLLIGSVAAINEASARRLRRQRGDTGPKI